MQRFCLAFLAFTAWSCSDNPGTTGATGQIEGPGPATAPSAAVRHFRGAVRNGMKGDSLFFDLSADGKTLSNLSFRGYWRCAGRLEQTRTGPAGTLPVVNGKVKGQLSDPPDGGATSWHFALEATIQGTEAQGTFRMNINNLGCDTYQLQWSARAAAD